jgi:hypothetical protein
MSISVNEEGKVKKQGFTDESSMLYSHLFLAHQASEATRASHNISTVFKRLHSNNCTHSLHLPFDQT